MKVQRFEIHLHAPQPVYYGGQTVSGIVLLELAAELEFRAIELDLNGRANVNWSERHGTGKNRRTVHYRNNETYLDLKVLLCGDGKDRSKLPPGSHSFPFSITIPPNLPSTFMGPHGRVLYWLKCKIDRPWKVDNTVQLYITVISLLDLNQDPHAPLPVTNTGTKTFGCLWCKTGPLNASISLPKIGFVCGETIFFSASIENTSDKLMTKSTIKLVQTDIYKASTGRIKSVPKIIMSHQEGSINPGDSFTWSNIGLLIPPLPPSHLIFCNIIDIIYSVVLSVDPSGIGFDLEVPVNITIGTIPLRQQYQQIGNYASTAEEMPPVPSYNEAVHGKLDIAQEEEGISVQGGGAWAPSYPTYAFNSVIN